MFKKRILIDLDGVLNEYGKEKYDKNKIPKIKIGAKCFIKKLSKIGELYLFTSRDKKSAMQWLIDNNIEKYFINVTNIKIPAYIYIDDRAICFQGNFKKTIEDIKNFQIYWKNQ